MDALVSTTRSAWREMDAALADLSWFLTSADILVVLLAIVFAFVLFGNSGFDGYLFLLLLMALGMVFGFRALHRFCGGAMERLRQLSELAQRPDSIR